MQLRLTLFFVFATAFVISAVPINEHGKYSRYIKFPGGDGNLYDVDLEAEPDMDVLAEVTRNPANNVYLLYTRQNPSTPQVLTMNDASSVRYSNYNSNHQTVVIVHGWLSNQNSDLNAVIRDAYLGKGEANVIVMEWRRLALSNYVTAVRGVPAVGRGLGQFMNFLKEVTGAPFSSMHLVGFSLGAHVVGNAGRELGGQLARVTGLDPAGPLWNLNSNAISDTDAIYVEGIHTDGSLVGLGIGSAIGHADFFPNGGNSQPGCWTSICDHNRAWELFAASVTYNHLVGQLCTSSLQITMNRCRGQQFRMGNDDLRKWGSGKYRVNTGRDHPF